MFDVVHQDDANKAHFLASLYFPEISQATGNYIDAYANLCLATNSLFVAKDEQPLGGQVIGHSQYSDARDTYLAARDSLQKNLEIHSSVASYIKCRIKSFQFDAC